MDLELARDPHDFLARWQRLERYVEDSLAGKENAKVRGLVSMSTRLGPTRAA